MLTGKYRPNQPRVPPAGTRRRWHPTPPLQAARGGKEYQTSPLQWRRVCEPKQPPIGLQISRNK